MTHDCTTLGGNSGSPVVDLATGKVCGLHFSGGFLRTNYAVPILAVSNLFRRFRNGELLVSPGRVDNKKEDKVSKSNIIERATANAELRVTIPVEISVRVGQPVQSDKAAAVEAGGVTAITFGGHAGGAGDLKEAVAEAKRMFGSRPDVVNIESGWKFRDGWITDERAVVIEVRKKKTPQQLEQIGLVSLPKQVLGVPVDVRTAPLRFPTPGDVILEEARVWVPAYKPWPEVLLDEINEVMQVTAHFSPDAGWPVCRILEQNEAEADRGNDDFTVPHIVEAVKGATKPATRSLSLVLQRGQDIGKGTKKNDIPDEATVEELREALNTRFSFAWASARFKGALFKSSYHIKVAVRDSSAL